MAGFFSVCVGKYIMIWSCQKHHIKCGCNKRVSNLHTDQRIGRQYPKPSSIGTLKEEKIKIRKKVYNKYKIDDLVMNPLNLL